MRIIRSVLLTSGAALGLVCIVLFLAGAAFGIRPAVVVSGSMEPTLPVGSLILVRQVPAETLTTGDIVMVPRPDGSGLTTHRVVATEGRGDGIVALTLRGDANSSPDPWPYQVREAGLHLATVPLLGYAALFLRTPAGIATVIVGMIVALALLAPGGLLGRGGRTRRSRGAEAARRE